MDRGDRRDTRRGRLLRGDAGRASSLFERARDHYIAGGAETDAAAMDARVQRIAKDAQRPRKVAAGRLPVQQQPNGGSHDWNHRAGPRGGNSAGATGGDSPGVLCDPGRRRLQRGVPDLERRLRPAARPALVVGLQRCGADVIAAVGLRAQQRSPRSRFAEAATASPDSPAATTAIVIDLSGDERGAGPPAARRAYVGGGAVLERRRPRDAGARTGDDRRAGVDHGRRRLHARRRHRLADAPARPRLRQPDRRQTW